MSTSTVCSLAPAVLILCVAAAATVTRHPLVVVVSFDGFHPDYVRPDTTPTLFRFRNASAAPPYMRPVFPTKTFVNHLTIATGLYPEQHGVLDNYMFDRQNNTMHYTYEQFHYDETVVPIWMQNEYSGNGRYSGVMMWPGSEFKYQGKTPTHVQIYNKTMSWNSRVDKIMSWIKNSSKPANLVFAYFEEPDKTSHLKGVDSPELKVQIARVDATVKYLLEKIKEEHLENKINLIILSDHGMDTVTYDRIIHLDQFVSNKTYESVITGPNGFILPNPGKFEEVYRNLSKGASSLGTFDVYKKGQLPDRWHMKNTSRLNGKLYILAKPGYAFWYSLFEYILNSTSQAEFRAGGHGYDNDEPKMRATFMASGPAFRKNFTGRPFDNVHVYPMISHVLDLKEPTSDVRPDQTTTDLDPLLTNRSEWAGSSGSGSGAEPYPVAHFRGVLSVVLLHAVARRLLL